MVEKGGSVWTPDKEVVRRLLVLDNKTREQIIAEGEHSKALVDKTIYMMENGLAPPLTPPDPLAELSEENTTPQGKGGKVTKKRDGVSTAPSFNQSNLLRIVPRSFTTSSLTVWLAMQVCQKVWGWKVTDPGEFIDRFITTAMEAYGITLASYSLQPGVIAVDQGNGQGEQVQETELEETGREEIVYTGEEA
jgi:hypothetical protein